MRLADYFRLGFAGVKASKKRAFTVVMIVGLMLSMVAAGTFALQGIENTTLGTMLAPTDGKTLIISSVDMKICGEDCNIAAEIGKIKKSIEKYGGKIIPTKISQTADGMFYELGGIFFDNKARDVTNATQIAVPLRTAAALAGIEMPERDAKTTEKIDTARKVRKKTLGKIAKNRAGKKYYIAEILPDGAFMSSLSLSSIDRGNNPLNLILEQIRTGTSQNFIIKSAETEQKANRGETNQLLGPAPMKDIAIEEAGMVFAEFENIEAAHNYYLDKVNYCSETDRIFNRCSEDYKYQVSSAISDPITTYENLQNLWLIFKVVAAVLTIIALIIAISTYGRLIGKDTKIIALYQAMGANKRQIRLVYTVYLLILSMMAAAMAIAVGLGLAVALSLINMSAMKQVFMLGLGTEVGRVWMIGWNNLVLGAIGTMVLAAVMAVLLSNGNFGTKKLARRLK